MASATLALSDASEAEGLGKTPRRQSRRRCRRAVGGPPVSSTSVEQVAASHSSSRPKPALNRAKWRPPSQGPLICISPSPEASTGTDRRARAGAIEKLAELQNADNLELHQLLLLLGGKVDAVRVSSASVGAKAKTCALILGSTPEEADRLQPAPDALAKDSSVDFVSLCETKSTLEILRNRTHAVSSANRAASSSTCRSRG